MLAELGCGFKRMKHPASHFPTKLIEPYCIKEKRKNTKGDELKRIAVCELKLLLGYWNLVCWIYGTYVELLI